MSLVAFRVRFGSAKGEDNLACDTIAPNCKNRLHSVLPFSPTVIPRAKLFKILEVTSHVPKVLTVFLLRKWFHFFFFVLLREFPWRAFRRAEVEEDQ